VSRATGKRATGRTSSPRSRNAQESSCRAGRAAGGTWSSVTAPFRKALCARAIITRWPKLDLNHVRALIASGPKGPADLVNYWSEPIALLAAQVADTDAWIIGLAQDAATRGIALRALASARHLSPRSIVDLVTALPDWRDRAKVYEQLVERTDRDRLAGIVGRIDSPHDERQRPVALARLGQSLGAGAGANAMALRPLVIAVRKPSDLSALAVVPGRHRVELWCRVEGGRLGLVGLPRCEAHVGGRPDPDRHGAVSDDVCSRDPGDVPPVRSEPDLSLG
jgi:hypothetical protein